MPSIKSNKDQTKPQTNITIDHEAMMELKNTVHELTTLIQDSSQEFQSLVHDLHSFANDICYYFVLFIFMMIIFLFF
jgi:hypothetical protein